MRSWARSALSFSRQLRPRDRPHCTDETGQLQSFEERFERMTAWQARRSPGTPRAEIERQTLAYMATMPAWRDHPRVTSGAG
jgi:hypothetical protein